jgi:predicted negative regulator of RcsB-dependent stress response
VDTRTRHALKKDRFASATASSVSWLSSNRDSVQRWGIAAAAVLVVGIGVLIYWSWSTSTADSALGAALDTYDAPLAQPNAPPENGIYATANERAQAANKQFVAVARQYGWLATGAKAHYFAGITYRELGQNGAAESELKTAAGSWDHNLSNLAKLALADLYTQTERDGEAIDLYNALAAKPSLAVSTSVAQLDLAALYAATGKKDEVRAMWAKVKDSDKDGAAAQIAAQKLNPQAAVRSSR